MKSSKNAHRPVHGPKVPLPEIGKRTLANWRRDGDWVTRKKKTKRRSKLLKHYPKDNATFGLGEIIKTAMEQLEVK